MLTGVTVRFKTSSLTRVTKSFPETPRPDSSTSVAKPEGGDERLFTPSTAEVISIWAAQKRSSIAPSCVRAMLGYIADVWRALYEGCLCDCYPQGAEKYGHKLIIA
jgi:hypothetical protein